MLVRDHSKLRPDQFLGGFSFAVDELVKGPVAGWFSLLDSSLSNSTHMKYLEYTPEAGLLITCCAADGARL